MTTFIVRLLAATPHGCRGRVRHVRTGREESFQDWDQLRDFLARMTSDAGLAILHAVEGEPPGDGEQGTTEPTPRDR